MVSGARLKVQVQGLPPTCHVTFRELFNSICPLAVVGTRGGDALTTTFLSFLLFRGLLWKQGLVRCNAQNVPCECDMYLYL